MTIEMFLSSYIYIIAVVFTGILLTIPLYWKRYHIIFPFMFLLFTVISFVGFHSAFGKPRPANISNFEEVKINYFIAEVPISINLLVTYDDNTEYITIPYDSELHRQLQQAFQQKGQQDNIIYRSERENQEQEENNSSQANSQESETGNANHSGQGLVIIERFEEKN